jgi:hypothetical protein
MARSQVADGGEGLQIWRVAANILNKQSRTADKVWTSSLGVGRGANNSPPENRNTLRNVTKGLGIGRIDHILVDRRRQSSIFDVRYFRGVDCDTNHYLVAAKLRERQPVIKRVAQKFDIQRFDLRKLNDAEVKEQYQVNITNRFTALENCDDNVDMNTARENIRENIKTSAKRA